MEQKSATMDLAGREFKITNAPIATGATGYAIVSLGDTVIMANASMSEKGKEGADFFPMVVDYEDNFYAAGKIRGSRFVKRGGRPSENAILIARMIDRPVRPLFPKGTTNEVQIIASTLSADLEVDPATTAMNAASAALLLSGAPFQGPIGAVRMGYIGGELIVNPTYSQTAEGTLNLIVAGTLDAITMVEAAAKEVTEEVLLKALAMAHVEIKRICQFQLDYAAQFDIEKIEADIAPTNDELIAEIKGLIPQEMLDGISGTTKKEVKVKIHAIEEMLFEKMATKIETAEVSKRLIAEILNGLMEKNMRKKILEQEIRLDGRKINEIRPITIIPDVLPRTHGSAIFQRGETTALTITTLGGPGDAQIVDTMDSDEVRRYFHHYNFPPYATGEIKMLRGASRREIGHGDLAERALLPVLPDAADFPYTMWLVSEIIKCNGSSSMASVCGSTLSLMCAGVPLKKPVSGIAMGLVMDKETGKYKILSDIQGMEDFAGDMDFKVTGTPDGITALQMDIKVKGLSLDLMKEALDQAKEGRLFILNKMIEAVPVTKPMSKYAPLILSVRIDPDMIGLVIGKGGETIQGMTKEFEVEIDIADDGLVTITSPTQEGGQKALDRIKQITHTPEVGEVFTGKVVKIMEFGAFVEIAPGKDGLVHISELSNQRVNNVEDVVKEGDMLKVKLLKIDEKGRLSLSHKALLGEGDKEKHPDLNNGEKAHTDTPADAPTGHDMGHGERVEGTSSVRKIN